MTSIHRQLLNVRVIGTTFRTVADTHPAQITAAIGKARNLLAEARADAMSDEVRHAIEGVEAELDAAGDLGKRREG